MEFRRATIDDIEAIATLHAESWRRSYRGSYSDAFLDGDVYDDRRQVWSARLTNRSPSDITIVAGDGGAVVGFAHTMLDEDPEYGALLDNLHVTHDRKGSGVGTQLMAETAAAVIAERPGSPLYLYVLERNTAAQAFYDARGGKREGRHTTTVPGGGSVVALRVTWRDPSVLLL